MNISQASEYRRIELFGFYEKLSPDLYGDWKTGTLNFYHKPVSGFTYFVGISGFSRKEGNASLVSLGAYKDWTENIYTYTALSHGTYSTYLPKLRFDGETYLKLGERKNFVPAFGLSYIKYYTVHKDLTVSLGLTYYADGWNITYKQFFNKSDPGSVDSSSSLISVGIGKEKASWTYLDISYGKQAYLATYLATPEEVRQKSLRVGLKHRRWFSQNWGIILEADYLKLEKGYEKYGLGFGVFSEF